MAGNWESPPTEHVGNMHWSQVMQLPDNQLRSFVDEWRKARYSPRLDGQRTWGLLGHEEFEGRRILDYGCGLGLEAVLFGLNGNLVSIADIHAGNLVATTRLMLAHGLMPQERILTAGWLKKRHIGTFYANGVLHHSPFKQASALMQQLSKLDTQEIRLLVYTDNAWEWATGTKADRNHITDHEAYPKFVRTMDAVGNYAEWYDEERMEQMLGPFKMRAFDRVTENQRFAIVKAIR